MSYAAVVSAVTQRSSCGEERCVMVLKTAALASHADILLAGHALLPKGGVRDEPKECLRGRLRLRRRLGKPGMLTK